MDSLKDPPPTGWMYAVFCHQDGEVYQNPISAERALGTPRQMVAAYASGRRTKDVFGYTFEYAYDQTHVNRGRKLVR